jgi:hypothetical protein
VIKKGKCHVRIALVFGLLGLATTWLLWLKAPPLWSYFLDRVQIPNLWARIHTIPHLVVVVFRPSMLGDAMFYFLAFLQWMIIGFLISFVVCRLVSRP